MDVVGWTKSFCLKVWSKIEDRLAGIVAGIVLFVAATLCVVFSKWATAKHPIETYGFVWDVAVAILIVLMLYFIRSKMLERFPEMTEGYDA